MNRRICIVTETWRPDINGVAHTLGRLADGLAARGHRLDLVRPGGAAHAADAQAVEATTLVPGLPLPLYRNLRIGLPAAATLRRRWRERRPDVVYVATEGPLGWSAVKQARRDGIPVVSGFHTNFHRYSRHYGAAFLRPGIYAYLRLLHNRSRCTLVPTRALREELLADGFAAVEVMGRGVDAELFCPARRDQRLRRSWGLADDDLGVIYVGRLAAEKNLPLALAAFARVRAQRPQAKLLLVGDGPLERELAAGAREVVLCGAQTNERLAAHYASADLFLFPSETETYGNVVLEAMASGLPVLAFDYAAGRELITDRHDGRLVPLGRHDAFIAAAGELAAQGDTLRDLGVAARRSALGHGWQPIIDRFESLLLAAANGGEP